MLEYLIYLILFIIIIWSLWIELYKWRLNKQLKHFATAVEYPIIGSAGLCIGKNNFDISEIVTQIFENQPDSVTAGKGWIGTKLLLTFTDPDDIRIILNSDDCLDKPYVYRFLNANNSILALDKQQWKHDRRQLNTTLNTKMVASFYPLLNKKVKLCTEIIANGTATAPDAIDFHRIFVKCLFDMFFVTSLSTDCHLQTTPDGDILHDALNDVSKHSQNRIFKPWLKWDFIYQLTNAYDLERRAYLKLFNKIHDVAVTKSSEFKRRLINHRKNSSGDIEMMTLLEKCFQLFRNGKMSEAALNDNAYIITAAAADSSSTTLLCALMYLAIHPAIQERCVDELRSVFERADSPVTPDDIARLVYLDMIVKETLRLSPPIPLIGRECTADVRLPSGTIPKGALIVFNIEKIHRQRRNWGPRANEFYPEHFSPENTANMHPYKFLAFSGGNRNCIGARFAMTSVKFILIYLLRRFQFSTDLRMEDIKTVMNVVRKVTNENPLRCKRRVFK